MSSPPLLSILLASLLLPVLAFYDPSGPVTLLSPESFEQKVRNSKHATIVEFFAPWCGHCKSFAPAYSKAAEHMKGTFPFAAIDCDNAANRPLCAEFGVKGFPTVKLMRPVSGNVQPLGGDYTGPRTAKGLTDFAKDNIENLVVRLTDDTLAAFLERQNDTAKSIMFSKKGPTSALWKSLAIDFQGKILLAQARDTQTSVVNEFTVDTFPRLVVLPGGATPGVVYSGQLLRDPMFEFLSGYITKPKPSASASAKPKIDYTPQALDDIYSLSQYCFPHGGTCYLLLSPSEEYTAILTAINARINPYNRMRIYTTTFIRPDSLIFGGDTVEMIALNTKHKWYKRFEGTFTEERVLEWMDAVKMGEGKKWVFPNDEEVAVLAEEMGRRVVVDPETNGMEVDEEGNVLKDESKDEVKDDGKEEAEEAKERIMEEVKEEGTKEDMKEKVIIQEAAENEGIKEVFGDETEQKHDEL